MVEHTPSRASAAPHVGVVTVSYGSRDALEPFLVSLREQHGVDVPVVIVDNKPSDEGVGDLAEQFGARYVPLPQNPGYGAGMNAGARALQAASDTPFDAYFFCNPDVIFTAPAISELATSLLSTPKAGSIGPRTLNDDGTVYPSARDIPSVGTGVGHALFGKVWPRNPWSRAYKNNTNYDKQRAAGWLSGAAVMVRGDVYEQVEGWDEAYFLHFEDIDLGYRIGLAGYTNVFDPAVTIVHTGGHSLKKHSAIAERAMTESAIRFMRKRYSGALRAPVRWSVIAGLRVRGALKSALAR